VSAKDAFLRNKTPLDRSPWCAKKAAVGHWLLAFGFCVLAAIVDSDFKTLKPACKTQRWLPSLRKHFQRIKFPRHSGSRHMATEPICVSISGAKAQSFLIAYGTAKPCPDTCHTEQVLKQLATAIMFCV
jgi:hypothetical protein